MLFCSAGVGFEKLLKKNRDRVKAEGGKACDDYNEMEVDC